MDLALELCDNLFLDKLYQSIPIANEWERNSIIRQTISLFGITYVFALLFYFTFSGLSFLLIYDKNLMKHPKFLKNQVQKEIKVAVDAMIPLTLLTIPWFLGEVRGYSLLYSNFNAKNAAEWCYLIASVILFLFFTDCLIYWIHRYLHHPLFYSRLHKPHHRWLVPTPFASHAFHPLDGYLQSVPYHIFVYVFPMHKFLYMFMFVFVNLWTVSIHDGEYLTKNKFINGAANHTIHHLYFNYNYGQYFTLWDWIGGTLRQPNDDQYKRQQKKEIYQKEALAIEKIFKENPEMKEQKVEYLVESVSDSSKVLN